MRRNDLSTRFFLPLLALVLTFSMAGCSGCGGGGADTADSPATGPDAVDQAVDDADAGHDHDGHDLGDSGDAGADADGHGTAAKDPWDRTYESPEAERAGTVENLQGLRATLVAELDQVRGRLKDGTRSGEDRKADTQRAAELAQGLERLDRTIKQIDEANDVTWSEVRDSEMKAAREFREWMAKYGMAG